MSNKTEVFSVKLQEVDELDDEFESEDEDTNPNVFKIHEPLQPPQASLFSTQVLHGMIHEGVIDLNPSYQRGDTLNRVDGKVLELTKFLDVVWPESKQIGLIDSIFRNFYIPPIVFAVQRDDEGEEVRICVDGKQRLTSIQKFFDGQIPHKDVKTKKTFWYTTSESWKGIRNQVPESFKRDFAEKQITCVEYVGLTPGSEREIFQRVQLGMTLTAAEKLQAISSPWAEWITQLEARHVTVEGGLSDVLEWDTKRGRDFQNIAHMVFCCDGLPDELLPTAQKIEKWISRIDNPPEQFKTDIEEVLTAFWRIASSNKHDEGFTKISQRIAPVEFIFIGVLLYRLRGESLENQGRAIYILRYTIRQEFKDIRNNTGVGRSLWMHINNLRLRPTTWLTPNALLTTKGKGKRKADKNNEGDDEYRPTPISSLGKPLKTRAKRTKAD